MYSILHMLIFFPHRSEYEQYADFETTLQTEFELLFGNSKAQTHSMPMPLATFILTYLRHIFPGEFQDGWTDSREMATFTVLYLLVLFLLVLNFLLAIIVEVRD